MRTESLWSQLASPRLLSDAALTPFLKWPGGKSQELAAIAAAAPPLTGRLVDPFVGGASVLLATPPEVTAVVNDACRDLIELYRSAADGDAPFRTAVTGLGEAWEALGEREELFRDLAEIFLLGTSHAAHAWLDRHRADLHLLLEAAEPGLAETFFARAARDLPVKFRRMRVVESEVGERLSAPDLLANIEGAVRSALYMSVRARYNEARLAGRWDARRAADFFFLREYTYAAMFRFNARDEFNVPYGGITYNRKSLLPKIAAMFSAPMRARLSTTTFTCQDFEPFLAAAGLEPNDFLFIDPPYDSDFSNYDNMPFGSSDQVRLRDVLESVPCQVMVVIKDTPAIRRLYGSGRWTITHTPKTYMWTIKSRNDRAATHLTITNY